MFAKLLKHEFKNSRSTLGLLTVVCLGVAVLAAIAMKLILVGEYTETYTSGFAVLMVIAMPLLVLSLLAVIAYVATSNILLYVQFFRNKFTDEGYLTFTLPTSVHNLYLSSLVNMFIWQIITIVTFMASIAIFVLFGTSADQFINTEVFRLDFSEMEMVMATPFAELNWSGLDTIQTILRAIIGAASSLVLATTCITIGATVAKKRKALAAIGIYIGMSYVINGIASSISVSLAMNATDFASLMSVSGWVTTALNLGVIVGGYFLTTNMMKNKLNLP